MVFLRLWRRLTSCLTTGRRYILDGLQRAVSAVSRESHHAVALDALEYKPKVDWAIPDNWNSILIG